MKTDRKFLYTVIPPETFERPTANWMLAQNLVKYMQSQNAIGLAANQVGIPKRLFVMQVDAIIRHCFNPEVLWISDTTVQDTEGCVSFPGQTAWVERAQTIGVKYQDHRGQPQQHTLSGLAARCYLHELDHLNGVTMLQQQRQQQLQHVLSKSRN
jgi:peptide deformylase